MAYWPTKRTLKLEFATLQSTLNVSNADIAILVVEFSFQDSLSCSFVHTSSTNICCQFFICYLRPKPCVLDL